MKKWMYRYVWVTGDKSIWFDTKDIKKTIWSIINVNTVGNNLRKYLLTIELKEEK